METESSVDFENSLSWNSTAGIYLQNNNLSATGDEISLNETNILHDIIGIVHNSNVTKTTNGTVDECSTLDHSYDPAISVVALSIFIFGVLFCIFGTPFVVYSDDLIDFSYSLRYLCSFFWLVI